MNYRTGNHNPALVYREAYGSPDRGTLVAVFVEPEAESEAQHYVRAMNAEMPTCTCRVVCCCGALVGTTSGCETCMEHNGECIDADLGELLDQLTGMARERGPDDQIITHVDIEMGDLRTQIMERFGWLGRYAS